MKTLLFTFFALAFSSSILALEGENLDLKAVLNLFEKSKSIEDFEMSLNNEKNNINNLDLNQDGFVDFICVIDYQNENTHSITLQVPFSNGNAQDVAVILVEQDGRDMNIVQIIGDPALYGENYIIEPGEENNSDVTNVYTWVIIRYIYAPGYHPYYSPYGFNNYPVGFIAWQSMSTSWYISNHYPYHIPCRPVHVHRCNHAHQYYLPQRKSTDLTNPNGRKVEPASKPVHSVGQIKASQKTTNKQENAHENAEEMAPEPSRSTGAPAPRKVSAPQKVEGKPTKRPGGTVTPQSNQRQEKQKRP